MKTATKKTLSILGCILLTWSACLAWAFYHDILAGVLLLGALCCSCIFNKARKEAHHV